MKYADLLLSIDVTQKYEILKLRTTEDLMAYAQAQNLNFTQDQAQKLITKIKQYNKELSDDEKKTVADSGRISSEAPCRYCGSTSMELSVDSYGIYLTCSACKCNIIEV